MGLTVNNAGGGAHSVFPEGTFHAVCNKIIDLGMQKSEKYGHSQQKVLIGWITPDETEEFDGKERPRSICKIYTASLNEKSNLRRDLAAWRGRDFTEEELAGFDMRNIVGANCFLTVIHTDRNGKTYSNIAGISALPKSVQKLKLEQPPTIYDIDTDDPKTVDSFPDWIKNIILESESFHAKLIETTGLHELPDGDGTGEEGLPF